MKKISLQDRIDLNQNIKIEDHKGIIFQLAKKMQSKYPKIEIEDIIQEINLLVLSHSKDYNFENTVSTFIMNYIGLKIKTVLMYRYVDFKYDNTEGKQKPIFIDKTSLDAPNQDNTMSIGDLKQVSESFDNMYDNKDNNCSEIEEIINQSKLNDTEKEIILLRYGFKNNDIPMKLEDIAIKFGKSKQAIAQRLNAIEEKLLYNSKLKEIARTNNYI